MKAQQLAHAWKITATLIIWHEVRSYNSAAQTSTDDVDDVVVKRGLKPVYMDVELSTYPNFQLKEATAFILVFKLTTESTVECWASTEADWVLGTTRTVFPVDPSNRVPLHLCANIFEQWSNEDCPGLSEELQLQLQHSK